MFAPLGISEHEMEAYFSIGMAAWNGSLVWCVVGSDAPSYLHRYNTLLPSVKDEMKTKYCDAVKIRHASFTTRVVSVDGLFGWECLVKHIADKIAIKWNKSNLEVVGWVRDRLCFAILRATNECLWGFRTKWINGTTIDDGAGLPYLTH